MQGAAINPEAERGWERKGRSRSCYSLKLGGGGWFLDGQRRDPLDLGPEFLKRKHKLLLVSLSGHIKLGGKKNNNLQTRFAINWD